MGSDTVGTAEYQAVAGGSVTVYVDNGKGLTGPTLGGAGYSRVCVRGSMLSHRTHHLSLLYFIFPHQRESGWLTMLYLP